MRVVPLCVILGLALCTDIVFGPSTRFGFAYLDAPLLVLLFLAQRDRRPRIYVTLFVIACTRSAFGIDELPLAWLPLALAVETQQLFRLSVHLRDPWRRLPVLAVGLVAAGCFRAYLHSWMPPSMVLQVGLQGAILGTLCGVILFPILDLIAPLLRSHRYPL